MARVGWTPETLSTLASCTSNYRLHFLKFNRNKAAKDLVEHKMIALIAYLLCYESTSPNYFNMYSIKWIILQPCAAGFPALPRQNSCKVPYLLETETTD